MVVAIGAVAVADAAAKLDGPSIQPNRMGVITVMGKTFIPPFQEGLVYELRTALGDLTTMASTTGSMVQ